LQIAIPGYFTLLCFVVFVIADPTFDLLPPVKTCQTPTFHSYVSEPPVCQSGGQRLVCNVEMPRQQTSSKQWDADVSRLMSSEQWLKIYGLKAAKLDMNYLLRQIAFRHSDGKCFCSLDLCFMKYLLRMCAQYRELSPTVIAVFDHLSNFKNYL